MSSVVTAKVLVRETSDCELSFSPASSDAPFVDSPTVNFSPSEDLTVDDVVNCPRRSVSTGSTTMDASSSHAAKAPFAALAQEEEPAARAPRATGGDLVGYSSIHHPTIGRDGMVVSQKGQVVINVGPRARFRARADRGGNGAITII